ncbi:DNA polymerase III subunit delta' [bacterium AH-315-J19]|nr:DNA polymerase III subunit delta' [Robiginitomaculum sp.]MBN4058585.1 DNA polymerase III subunit delta' [bacterium AH-315-J19]
MAKAVTDAYPEADRADGCPRPRDVYALLGHTSAEARFAKMFANNSLHHAWLISGPKGIGKATLAYRMIRTALGGQPQNTGKLDVPASDPVAQRVQSLGHGDFLLIRRPYDPKTKKLRAETPIAEARKVSEFFSRKASEGGWRVCLIDSIDEMNRNATNALLKTLEEPPERALLILISHAPGRLLPTIRSRCMALPLRPVPETDLRDWLAGQVNAPAEDVEDVEAAVKLAGGAPGKAFAYVQNAETVLRPLARFMRGFPAQNTRLYHTISDTLALAKNAACHDLFWDGLQDILHAQAIYAATGQWDGAYEPLALTRGADEWVAIRAELNQMRLAGAGLNMNKKNVLLQGLMRIGAD